MAERIIGDRAETQDFFRLFMIPGRSHCDQGVGAASGDFLTYLEDWVEKDKAPDVIVGYHEENSDTEREGSGSAAERAAIVSNTRVPDRYAFSRPHYPYPRWAKYRGSGDPNDYRSFEPVEPREK